MRKKSLFPPQAAEKQSTHSLDLVHGEETAPWPSLVISSLSLMNGPDFLSFLKIASDITCTWWSCEGTGWSSSDSAWQSWGSGTSSSALGRAAGPCVCPGRHFLSSRGWAASGVAHLTGMSSLFSQCLLSSLSSPASFPSTLKAAQRWGSCVQCASARCFHRGWYLNEAKTWDIHSHSLSKVSIKLPWGKREFPSI